MYLGTTLRMASILKHFTRITPGVFEANSTGLQLIMALSNRSLIVILIIVLPVEASDWTTQYIPELPEETMYMAAAHYDQSIYLLYV